MRMNRESCYDSASSIYNLKLTGVYELHAAIFKILSIIDHPYEKTPWYTRGKTWVQYTMAVPW